MKRFCTATDFRHDRVAGISVALFAIDPRFRHRGGGGQLTILFWDVLRQRSDQYYAQKAKAVPHVLSFGVERVRHTAGAD
jgi:hypothetical protein